MYRLKKFISARDRFTLLINNLPTRVVPLKIKVVAVDYEPHDNPKSIEGGYALCPMCNKWGNNIPGDYTSQEMIWCDCGAYLVLDTEEMVEIDIDSVYNELKSANIEYFVYDDKENLFAFEVPAVYILRGADLQIDDLEFIDGKYSEQKVREFMSLTREHIDKPELYEQNLKKYGLKKTPPIKYKSGSRKDTDEYERFYEYEPEYATFNPLDYKHVYELEVPYAQVEELDLKVYLPINSYDTDSPFFPFTEDLFWEHPVGLRMDCVKVLPDGRLGDYEFVVTHTAD